MTDSPKVLSGSAKVKVDDKGRLAIPNRFREGLLSHSTLVLTMHPHGCLSLYTESEFTKIQSVFKELGNVGYLDAHLEEVIIGCAELVSVDSAGRIMIQSHLRDRAVVRRDVLLFGFDNCIRIWDEERWEQRNLLLLSRMQDEGVSEQWRNLRI